MKNSQYHLEITVALLFCKANEKIYDDNILKNFDRVSEKHLIRALEGIKADIRKNYVDKYRSVIKICNAVGLQVGDSIGGIIADYFPPSICPP